MTQGSQKMKKDRPIDLLQISDGEKKLVENQLEIILASSYFHSAKQMRRFLEYIVTKTLIGDGKLLKQYTIGVEALDFPNDFDSDSNPAVRIMGGRVRNRLKEFYENTNNNEIIIDIPKGNYAPKFSYPDTNTSQLSVENEATFISSGPRLALMSYSDKTEGEMSNRLLLQTADKLAEEFSCFVSFNLIVYNPIGDKSESHGIGSTIDADYVLALYVQELPNKQFVLICRLVKTVLEEIIWSKSYDLDNQIAIASQEGVIRKIVTAIADMNQGKLHRHWARNLLLNKESIPNEFKVLAYYRQYYDSFNVVPFQEAVLFCESALEKNPNDIIINIVFADLCRRDYAHAYDFIDSSLDRGIECAERVTHLRRDSTEAHFALAQLLFSKGEWERSIDALNTARNISNAHALIEYGRGFYYCLMDRWDEGLILVREAIALSNSYPSWYHMPIFLYLYKQGMYKEALVEAKRIVTPNIPHGPLARCISYIQLGNIVKANKEFEEVVKRIPDMEENGKNKLLRLFGNEELVETMWSGIEMIVKD